MDQSVVHPQTEPGMLMRHMPELWYAGNGILIRCLLTTGLYATPVSYVYTTFGFSDLLDIKTWSR